MRGRGRSSSARWRSARRRSAPSIPIRRRASTTSPAASGPGRPRRGAAALRARAGDPRKDARPRASRYGDEPRQPRQLLRAQGDLAGARPLFERALDINEKALGAEHPSVLSGRSNYAALVRKEGLPNLAEPLDRGVFEATARARGIDHPWTVALRNNLALTLLMLDRDDEARHLLAESWHTLAPNYSNLALRILYLALLADRLRNNNGTGQIGRLKTSLSGPELPRAPGVAHPWDIAYLLDYLRPNCRPTAPNSSVLSSLRSTIRPRSRRLTDFPSGATPLPGRKTPRGLSNPRSHSITLA